jgi:hypothetical protein
MFNKHLILISEEILGRKTPSVFDGSVHFQIQLQIGFFATKDSASEYTLNAVGGLTTHY